MLYKTGGNSSSKQQTLKVMNNRMDSTRLKEDIKNMMDFINNDTDSESIKDWYIKRTSRKLWLCGVNTIHRLKKSAK